VHDSVGASGEHEHVRERGALAGSTYSALMGSPFRDCFPIVRTRTHMTQGHRDGCVALIGSSRRARKRCVVSRPSVLGAMLSPARRRRRSVAAGSRMGMEGTPNRAIHTDMAPSLLAGMPPDH